MLHRLTLQEVFTTLCLDTLENDINAGRKCVIKGLYIYLNENPEDLVQEYMASIFKLSGAFATLKKTTKSLGYRNFILPVISVSHYPDRPMAIPTGQ